MFVWPPACRAQDEPGSDTIKRLPGFGGPGSVPGKLKRDAKLKNTFIEPYFDFKTRFAKQHGFAYSIDYYPIIQTATGGAEPSLEASGAFLAYFYYALAGRRSGNTGALVFQVENRHRLGNDMLPEGLGNAIDYAGFVADPYGNVPWALTNFYWEQNLLNYHLTFLAGILDATDYTNVYALVDPWTDFYNLAFSNDLTIPIPDPGLGVAIYAQVLENIYLLGSLVDANGDPTKPLESFDSFFGDAAYFTSIELGWIKSLAQGYTDNIHLTFWHAAERALGEVPPGWGLAISVNRLLAERWSPFLRAGYASDGGAFWERSVSLGCGYHYSEIINQLGFGLNWGRPSLSISGESIDNQFTAEIYTRFNLWKVFTLTPDIQLLINPALNPDKGVVAVFGLRGRISL